MPAHSLRSDYSAKILRAHAARLPALQTRYATAIARLYEGHEIEAVAKDFNVQPHTVRRWMHVFNEQGTEGFGNAVIGGTYELRRDFDAQSVRALAERTFSPAAKSRLLAIAQMYEGVPTRDIARLSGVSDSTLSEWRQNFNTARIVAREEVGNPMLHANARVSSKYWTADKVAASIEKAWDDEHRRKLEVVKLSLEGRSVESIVQTTGSTRAEVVAWIRVFEAGGAKALSPSTDTAKSRRKEAGSKPRQEPTAGHPKVYSKPSMARNHDYTPNEIEARAKQYQDKAQAARLMGIVQVYRGITVEAVAVRRGVSRSAVANWLTAFADRGFQAFPDVLEVGAAKAAKLKPLTIRGVSDAAAVAPAAVNPSPKAAVTRKAMDIAPQIPQPKKILAATQPDIGKRGRGRPRKDGKPNKSTAFLMKMATGVRDTVKRIKKEPATDIHPVPRPAMPRTARVEIPFTNWALEHFLSEAIGDEHARRLRCMISLKDGLGIHKAAKRFMADPWEVIEWRDSFVKVGPVALLPKDIIETFRPHLTLEQTASLKKIELDSTDANRKAARAILMLDDDKGYPPYIAQVVDATIGDLLEWVGRVDGIAAPKVAKEDWVDKFAVILKETRDQALHPQRSLFQEHVLDVVKLAREIGGHGGLEYAARKHGIARRVIEGWVDRMEQEGLDRLLAATSANPVNMPDCSSADELRSLASTISNKRTLCDLRALAYLYDGASIALTARICRMSKEDLTDLVLDFNLMGMEALEIESTDYKTMAMGM